MSWKYLRQITEQLTDTLDRTPRDEARIRTALDTLCATGDPRALIPLVAILWPCFERQSGRTILGKPDVKFRSKNLQISSGLRDEAGTRLVKFLAHFPVYRLREIDHAIRRAGRDYWSALLRGTGWTCWVKAPEPAAVGDEPSRMAQLCLLSCHADGYVREAAIVALREDRSGVALPFLMLRTMDWVEPVARRAMAACELAITRAPESLLENLPLAVNLRHSIRPSAQWLYSYIGEVFTADEQRALLIAAIAHPDRRVARVAAVFAAHFQGAGLRAIATAAMSSRDVNIRRTALRWEAGLRATEPEFAAQLREHFLRDKLANLRSEALRLHVALGGDPHILRRALLDPAPAVRDTARFYLREMMSRDEIATVYRSSAAAAKTSAVIAAALSGLGEVGRQTDAVLLRGFLDATPTVAKAAMRALAKLDPEGTRGLLIVMLADRRVGVQRQALRLLDARLTNTDAAILRSHMVNEAMADYGPLALAMLRLPIWENLSFLLDVALIDSSAANDALHKWRAEARPHYAPPGLSRADGERLQSNLSAVAGKLDKHVAVYIQRALILWTQD